MDGEGRGGVSGEEGGDALFGFFLTVIFAARVDFPFAHSRERPCLFISACHSSLANFHRRGVPVGRRAS